MAAKEKSLGIFMDETLFITKAESNTPILRKNASIFSMFFEYLFQLKYHR
jgi:hypothetical protein